MSLFKEKDDYIKKAFQDIFCRDSDSEDEEFHDAPTVKKSKLVGEEEETSQFDSEYKGSGAVVCIEISDDSEDETPPKVSNEIKVKLQDGNLRHTRKFTICKDQTIYQLKDLYAKEFNIINLDSIKLWFDGELVDEGLTPEELDIEDDCVIDVMIHN